MALIGFMWALVSPKKMLSITFLFFFNGILNSFLKNYFQEPRPFALDMSVNKVPLLDVGFHYGLPSGAAQTITMTCGLVWFETKNFWIRCTVLFYAWIICFSRIYLGVHFVTDIAMGISLGLLIALAYEKLLPIILKYLNPISTPYKWGLTQCVAISPIIIFEGNHFFKFVVMLTGLAGGYYLAGYKDLLKDTAFYKRFFIGILQVISVALLGYLLRHTGSLLYFVLGIWIVSARIVFVTLSKKFLRSIEI